MVKKHSILINTHIYIGRFKNVPCPVPGWEDGIVGTHREGIPAYWEDGILYLRQSDERYTEDQFKAMLKGRKEKRA